RDREGGLHPPGPRQGIAAPSGHSGRRPDPPEADRDDHGDHGARARAHGPRDRKGRGPPGAPRDHRDRRADDGDRAHAHHRAGRVPDGRARAARARRVGRGTFRRRGGRCRPGGGGPGARGRGMIRASLRRPVAVAMTYGAIALLGVAAWQNVPIEMLPDTELPRLNVTATWRGASPETVEAFLTAPLEGAIQQVRGVERIVSESFESQGLGAARIEIEFERGVDMDFARLDLSERLATLEEELPAGADPVVVEQYVPEEFQEQNRPFLSYTFTGPYTLEALRQHLDAVVAPELAQVEGVALVNVSGGRERRLEIVLNEEAASSLGLEPGTVRARIAALDLVREAGVVREDGLERALTVVNRPGSAEDVRRAVIAVADGTPVTVADL